jgi:hypothetical protein
MNVIKFGSSADVLVALIWEFYVYLILDIHIFWFFSQ